MPHFRIIIGTANYVTADSIADAAARAQSEFLQTLPPSLRASDRWKVVAAEETDPPTESDDAVHEDSRTLLALLEQAQAIAERIDAARGHTLPFDYPLQPGESRGTDLAESISAIALHIREDILTTLTTPEPA